MGNLSAEWIEQMAKAQELQVKQQKGGKLVVYGKPENIKEFLKKVATERIKP